MEDILIDSKDRVYVATDGGLSILEAGQFRNYTTKDGLPNNILKALRMDHQGQLWIGTFEGGAVRFDGKYFTRYSSDDGLLNDRISSLWEDRSRRIWFGTDQGVTVLEGGVFRSYSSKDGLGAGKVGAIAEDSKGSMWFGTDSGLSHFDGRNFKTYSTADGLPDQFIRFLQFDRAGQLWIGTRKGLSQFDPSRATISQLQHSGRPAVERHDGGSLPSGPGWKVVVRKWLLESPDAILTIKTVHPSHLWSILRIFEVWPPVPRDSAQRTAPRREPVDVRLSWDFRFGTRAGFGIGTTLENFESTWSSPNQVAFPRSTPICRLAVTVFVSSRPAMKKTGAKLQVQTCASCRSFIKHHFS